MRASLHRLATLSAAAFSLLLVLPAAPGAATDTGFSTPPATTTPPATSTRPATTADPATTPAADPTAAWSTPIRVTARQLDEAAFTVDRAGHQHLVGRGDDGLWYLTDRTGAWTEQRLTRDGPEVEFERTRAHHPAIALDPVNGSIVVAWVRSEPTGTGGCSGDVRYRTLTGGRWSATRDVPTPSCAGPIDLAAKNGRLTVAISLQQIEYERIAIVAGRPGHWTTTYLGDDPAGGLPIDFANTPALDLDAAGRPSVAYLKGQWTGDTTQATVRWAHHVDGQPGLTSDRVRRYVDDNLELLAIDLVLDGRGRPRITWIGTDGTWVATLGAAGWSQARVTDPATDVAIAIDAQGRTVLAVADGSDGLKVFRRDAAGWSRTATLTTALVPVITGLVRDHDGALHLGWLRGRQYETSHAWVAHLD